jgi:hypothetical protein
LLRYLKKIFYNSVAELRAETSDKLILCDDYDNLNYLDKSEYINKGFTYVPF